MPRKDPVTIPKEPEISEKFCIIGNFGEISDDTKNRLPPDAPEADGFYS